MKNRSSRGGGDRSNDVEERVSLTSAAIDDIDGENNSFKEVGGCGGGCFGLQSWPAITFPL